MTGYDVAGGDLNNDAVIFQGNYWHLDNLNTRISWVWGSTVRWENTAPVIVPLWKTVQEWKFIYPVIFFFFFFSDTLTGVVHEMGYSVLVLITIKIYCLFLHYCAVTFSFKSCTVGYNFVDFCFAFGELASFKFSKIYFCLETKLKQS